MDTSKGGNLKTMELLFTPASILELLASIDELKDYEIGISETIDNHIQLNIGNSVYLLNTENAADIKVDEEVVDEVAEVNEEAYEGIVDNVDVVSNDIEPIESGVLKELAKSLLLGGMIRLSKKLL